MEKQQPTEQGPGSKPPPRCKAILLCDQVLVDVFTGHYSAIGIFDEFPIIEYPGTAIPFTVYVQLTDGIGDYAMTVEVQDLQDMEIAARAQGPTITFSERSEKIHMVIPVIDMPLEHPGLYDFVVLANDQEIDRQQFLAPSPDEESDDESNPADAPGEE